MGKYDLPATVNYITALTSQPSLYYIGHSLGTTQFFSGITLHPELAPKIRTMFSLATSGYINHSTNPFFRAVSLILASYTTEVGEPFGNGCRIILDNLMTIYFLLTLSNSLTDLEEVNSVPKSFNSTSATLLSTAPNTRLIAEFVTPFLASSLELICVKRIL